MMNSIFEIEHRKLSLERYPINENQTLRAWNAADEYLISEVDKLPQPLKNKILILNDSFGALSCALSQHQIVHSSDSYLSQLALEENLKTNQLSSEKITMQHSLENFPVDITLVILKIPKSLAMLEYQLIKINQQLNPGIKIIAASMVKELHSSTIRLFEKTIGTTTTSLAKKKARLVHTETGEVSQHKSIQTFPKVWELELSDKVLSISNHANVFSLKGLDLGARFMLENFPQGSFKNIVDLGCGNGTLGLSAKVLYKDAKISFVDESYMAVASAKTNWQTNFPENEEQSTFVVTDCLQGIPEKSVDLILCNPPFHQQQTITDQIAMQMFSESAIALGTKGKLIVIGNRHLGYHHRLKKWFKEVKQIAANKKFVIFSASN